MKRIKLLFLAANPQTTKPLALDEEIRKIEQAIRGARYHDRFEIASKWAVRSDDLEQALLEHRPHIVHFSGHGNPESQLLLVSQGGSSHRVAIRALRGLFSDMKDRIRLVVLNACFSDAQAKAISEVIQCVIGMNLEISDCAAAKFSASFYRAIGFGLSVQSAFNIGKTALDLEGISEKATPQLFCKDDVKAGEVRFFRSAISAATAEEEPNGVANIFGAVNESMIIIGNSNTGQKLFSGHPSGRKRGRLPGRKSK